MPLAFLFQGIPEALPLNPIARWEWVFPVVESVHICGFALLIGTAALLDFRLLGICWRRYPISRVAAELMPWIRAAIAVQIITGACLYSGDPREYRQVGAFRTKMFLLVIALIFHFVFVRRVAAPALDSVSVAWRAPVAVLSLGLWMSVMLAGLWIGNL